jgi:hypothetical protein
MSVNFEAHNSQWNDSPSHNRTGLAYRLHLVDTLCFNALKKLSREARDDSFHTVNQKESQGCAERLSKG